VARRALEGIAERRRLQTSFKLLTGNVAASLLEATAQADVLAMGTMGHMVGLSRRLGSTVRSLRASSHCSMLLLAQQPVRAGAPRVLVLVYSGSPDSARALDLALELARQREATSEETSLVVLLYGDAASRPELRQAVQARLADAGLSAAFDEVEPASLEQLRSRIRAWHGLLVVGQDSGLLDDPEHPPTGLGVPMLCVRCPGDVSPAEGG
jgi:hypothetical protein